MTECVVIDDMNLNAGSSRSSEKPRDSDPSETEDLKLQLSRLKGDTEKKLPNGKVRHTDDNGVVTHLKQNMNKSGISDGNHNESEQVSKVTVGCHQDESYHDGQLCKDADHCQCAYDRSQISRVDEMTSDIAGVDLDQPVMEDGRDIELGIEYVVYESELQMPDIMRLITKDLSEPYSIYTYRYFIHNWPKLCFLAMDGEKCVGAIVCKLDMHKKMARRGYIAMLAVDSEYRRKKIGSHLVLKAIKAMIADDCDEVVLETEITNLAALQLYENLGFVRDKRLFRYYLNGVDALRLKLWLR